MNANLSLQTRTAILEFLNQCTEKQQLLFRRMYSHKNLDAELSVIVLLDMPDEKLDHAFTQVERTVFNNQRSKTAPAPESGKGNE